jgi:hypothetical protein
VSSFFIVILSVKCCYAECHYAECYYTEYRGTIEGEEEVEMAVDQTLMTSFTTCHFNPNLVFRMTSLYEEAYHTIQDLSKESRVQFLKNHIS